MKRMIKRLFTILGVAILGLLAYGGFGLYRVYFGRHVYETTPPELPAGLREPAILVFSKTNGFREDHAIAAANDALRAMAARRHWSIFVTENGAVFNPEALKRFQAAVWNNVSGDVLTTEQKSAFRNYLENGGGFVGIHGAGGDPRYEWRWYVETVIGAQFQGRPMGPQFQQATIHIEDANDPATKDLPKEWSRTDEWYSFEKSPRAPGVRILATLGEAPSTNPSARTRAL